MAYPVWLLKLLQAFLILIFGPLSGIAFSLSAWVTPAIMRPENSSRSAIAQFSETISRGSKYLQPTSRISGLLMLLITLLISQHPDPSESWKWKLYGAGFLVVMQVAWWEVYFIFPINDIIKAMGEKLEGRTTQSLSEGEVKRLHELLLQWELRHRARIASPFFGLVVAVVGVIM